MRLRKLLRWTAVALGAASTLALAPIPAAAGRFDQAGDRAPITARYILRLQHDEQSIAAAWADMNAARALAPSQDAIDRMVQGFEAENAAFRYRQAIRAEQRDLLAVATQPDLQVLVERDAPAPIALVVHDTAGAWQALWRLDGIDEFNLVRIHPRPLNGAAPATELAAYYRDAAHRYQLDWSVLASINFIESDFGRVTGPSSAGALGPMQFLPSTWQEYGEGDIHQPKDAILAAARYLFLHGAIRSIDNAIFAYNHDRDYVAAVKFYAAAISRDPAWLDRLYYWNTTG